jgi:hypothetical protein
MKATIACTAILLAMLTGSAATYAQDYSPSVMYAVPNAFCPNGGSPAHCFGHHCLGHHCVPGCQPHYAPTGGVAPPAMPMTCGGGRGQGQGPPEYPVHPFVRSPRDFFMLQP